MKNKKNMHSWVKKIKYQRLVIVTLSVWVNNASAQTADNTPVVINCPCGLTTVTENNVCTIFDGIQSGLTTTQVVAAVCIACPTTTTSTSSTTSSTVTTTTIGGAGTPTPTPYANQPIPGKPKLTQ